LWIEIYLKLSYYYQVEIAPATYKNNRTIRRSLANVSFVESSK